MTLNVKPASNTLPRRRFESYWLSIATDYRFAARIAIKLFNITKTDDDNEKATIGDWLSLDSEKTERSESYKVDLLTERQI